MTKERYAVEIDGRLIDTRSKEWQLICLAREICRMPTKDARNAFVARLKWAPEAIDELQKITRREWARMYSPMQNNKGVANDNA